jgi:hypothetical protein
MSVYDDPMTAAHSVALVLAATLSGLPEPPERVVRVTARFGAVVLDHRAHVARRAPCKTCHGSGQVTKIERFGMKSGHAICRGCHEEAQRGPTTCRGCHVEVER